MRQLARQGKETPANILFAKQLIQQCDEKAWFQEIRAVFRFVQQDVRYCLDANGLEVLQPADLTIKIRSGDCDDKCILLATLLECVGHPAKFVALGFDPAVREYSHVIVCTSGAGETRWMALDATEPHAAGWYPPGVQWQMECEI